MSNEESREKQLRSMAVESLRERGGWDSLIAEYLEIDGDMYELEIRLQKLLGQEMEDVQERESRESNTVQHGERYA